MNRSLHVACARRGGGPGKFADRARTAGRPALGSWWGLLTMIANVAVLACLAWRLLEEERFLLRNLVGYRDDARGVPHRLLPLVW